MAILNKKQQNKIENEFDLTAKFIRYVKKTFKLDKIAENQKDSRKKQHASTSIIFMILFFGFTFRIKSFNQLEDMMEYGYFDSLFPAGMKMPSIDAISDISTMWDIETLKKDSENVIDILKNNKQFDGGTIDNYVVCALDGSDIITGEKKKCPACALMKNGSSNHYAHKAVVAMIVGENLNYVLTHRMSKVLSERTAKDDKTKEDIIITKSQGELTIAAEIIPELPKWIDVVVGDGLYFNAPFIKDVLKSGKQAIVRVKDKTTLAYKTMEHHAMYNQTNGSFSHKEKGENITVEYYYKDTVIEDSTVPKNHPERYVDVRLYKFLEIKETNIKGEQKLEFKETIVAVTDKNMPAKTIWKIIHKRWNVENTCFHQLKTYCSLEHCFRHDENSINVILTIMFMAFNIMQSFLFKRLRTFKEKFKKKKTTISGFIERLRCDFKIISFLIKLKLVSCGFLGVSYG